MFDVAAVRRFEAARGLRRLLLGSVSAAAALAIAPQALAQDATGQPVSTIEELVVTAEKRE